MVAVALFFAVRQPEGSAVVVDGTQRDEDTPGGETNPHPELVGSNPSQNACERTSSQDLKRPYLRDGTRVELLHLGDHALQV